MRLHLTLQHRPNQILPINYQYLISSWIYRTLGNANNEFAAWLHENGYERDGKKYKLFTFSALQPRRYEINPKARTISLTQSPTRLAISFHIEEAIQNFVMGLFQDQRFTLQSGTTFKADFEVSAIELQAKPTFTPIMRFRLQTPLCISQKLERDKHARYLHPESENFKELLLQNLLRKQQAMRFKAVGEESSPLDMNFLSDFQILSQPKSKLYHIKGTQIRGYLFDFQLTAPTDLLEIGYFAGFGEKNSALGMGMVKIIEMKKATDEVA